MTYPLGAVERAMKRISMPSAPDHLPYWPRPPSPQPPGSSPHAEAPAVLIVRDGADFAILWVMNPVKLASIALVAHTAHEPSTRDASS